MPAAPSRTRPASRSRTKTVKSPPASSARKHKLAVQSAKAAKPPPKSARARAPAAKPETTRARAKAPAAKSATTGRSGKAPAAKAKPKRYWVVRTSAIHGRGVFAARKIKKNRTIIEYRGERTTWEEANERPASDPDNPYHTFLFGLDDGRVIDAAVGGNAARWINHSCKPNCETEEDEDGRVFIKSRRKIAEGEELTYDYQLTYDGKMGKKMRAAYNCRCGAKRCRGTMLGKG